MHPTPLHYIMHTMFNKKIDLNEMMGEIEIWTHHLGISEQIGKHDYSVVRDHSE